MQLSAPLRFRFRDPDDIAAYGDGWFVWDELAMLGLKGRELIALEETVGPILAVIRGFHRDDRPTLATMSAMWIAMTRAGRAVAWDDFSPVVFATEWEVAPSDPLAGGTAPAPDSDSSTVPPESAASLTS